MSSRSKPPRRSRSGSPQTRNSSPRHRQHQHPVALRDIPRHVPSSANHAHALPTAVAEAVRQHGQEHNENIAAARLGYQIQAAKTRPASQKPDLKSTNTHVSNGSKRKTASQQASTPERPAALLSVEEFGDDESLPTDMMEFDMVYDSSADIPYEASDVEKTPEKKKKKKGRKTKRARVKDWLKRRLRRASSTPPSLALVQATQGNAVSHKGRGQGSKDRHRHRHRHHHRHHRRRHHRHHRRYPRSAKRSYRHYSRRKSQQRNPARNFFAPLRRTLGGWLKAAGNAVSIAKGPSASHGRSTYPSRRIRGWFPSISLQTSDRLACQRRVRRRRRIRRRRSFIPFMHGGRSPAPSRRYMPTRSRRRRFAATAESASDSGEQGPWIRASTRTGSDNHIRPRSRSAGIFVAARRLFGPFLHEPREPSVPSSGLGQRAIGWRDSAPSSARDSRPGRSRRSERRITRRRRASSTSSAISVTASRFLGPFLTQPSEPPTPESGMGQRRIGWRDRSLLSTGSAPVTPTSSRDSSLGGRGRSHKRYRSTSSSSMGIRGLFRRSRSASPSCDSSRDYGLQQMFASSAFSSTSSDYGLPRLFGSPRASSAPASSDYGLRRLFSAPTGSPASSEYGLGTLFVSTAASAASDYGLGRTFASPAASPAASSVSSFGMQRLFGD